MSHDTHNQPSEIKSSTTSFRSAIWFVILIAGLFIAAVNFVRAMSHHEEGHGGHEATEQAHHGAAASEHATEAPAAAHEHAAEEAGTADTAAHH